MHNPDSFDEPFAFKPERYMKDGKLDPSVLDPEAAAFGYGRRSARFIRRLGSI
jgi:cytochrome P450